MHTDHEVLTMASTPRRRRGLGEVLRDSDSFLPSRIVAVGGVIWVALGACGVLGPSGGTTFVVLAAVALFSTFLGIKRWKPEPLWPWLVLVGAFALWLVGGQLRGTYHTLGDLTSHRALVPDLFSLSGYALVVVGVVGVVGARSRGPFDRDAIIDAAISAVAAFLLTWVYVVTPTLRHHPVSLHVRLVVSAYVPCSIFVAATAARVASRSGRRPSPAGLMAISALGLLVVGDGLYLLAETGRLAIGGNLLNLPFALGFVACSSSLCHRSLPRMTSGPTSLQRPSGDKLRLAFVIVALCIPAAVLATPQRSIAGADRLVIATSALILSALAAWRMSQAITERMRTERQLAFELTHDALTGLPNRLSGQRHIQDLIEARTLGSSVAFLYIDLDRFKLVNETLGHGAGDELLRAVMERLRTNVRAGELLTRMGGDEFGLTLHGAASGTYVAEAAERIRLLLRRPFLLASGEVPLSASIGVAVYSASAGVGSSEQMLRDADTALYQAKRSGGDAVAFFDPSMRDHLAERLVLERELGYALERGQLQVIYQPVVKMADSRASGVEALLRWTHPALGSVEPAVFIPIAEESGLIGDIGSWVLDQACATTASLIADLGATADLSMAVNVSVRQFRGSDLLDDVARALARHQLPASALCLEITESVLIDNLTSVSAQLTALRARGVRILVDDFGTGYSSLAYLRHLPVNGVKIDRSFIEHIEDGGADASLVAAIVAMADSMGLSTIAEGVEHVAQAQRLRELGCGEAQGYLFAGPQGGELLAPTLRRLGLSSSRRLFSVTEGE